MSFHEVSRALWRASTRVLGDLRDIEYQVSAKCLADTKSLLDVACGTGTFLSHFRDRSIGIDINPDNVEFCKSRNLNAVCGSALELPFPDQSFDGVHCSHLLQVFAPGEAATCIREIGRVLRPGGLAVISALNWFPRFFRHPENVRPYPPDTFWRYFAEAEGAQSPMFPGMPRMKRELLWLRRPALIDFDHSTNKYLAGAGSVLNMVQYRLGLRKYWAYNSYIIALRKQ